ncbi:MAG: O-antigen ligase family protein [Clostridia bacterium]|nr:O-antigen ligase family protein [Clostridia bacterium]
MPQSPKKTESVQKPIRRGVVLHLLHAITALFYTYISHSLIGQLRTVYDRLQRCYERGVVNTTLHSRRKRHDRPLFRARVALASLIEQSFLYRALARLRRALLLTSVNTYGIFCFFFGCFTVVAYLLTQYFGRTAPLSHLVTGVCMIGVALPLFISDRPLCRVLGTSVFFRRLLVNICGIPAEKLDGVGSDETQRTDGEEHYFVSLMLAVVLGLLCALTSIAPYVVPAAVFLFLLIQLIFIYPEIGLLLIAFFTPLLTLLEGVRPTAVLLCAVGVTVISFIFKLIGGKRVFRPELMDGSVLLLGALYLLGGLVTRGGQASRLSALVYVALLLCYFLATGLLRTQVWIRRMIGALSLSCVIVSILGIGQYLFSGLGAQYLDLSLFSDISGRAYSTMENPNMLAEYLILFFPLLMALALTRKRPLGGFGMLLCCGAVATCLIFTWSRGAWLGVLVCTLLFLLLMGHKALSYLLLSALPAAAVLHYLPEQILRRFGSIGSMTDSSIRYRVYLWEGVGNMLRDYWFCGVGVGEAAFCEVYSRYALPGIASAMHSHNLYMQLLCELGVVGLLMFVAVVVLFVCYALSYITGRGEREGRMIVLGGLCGILSLLLMGMTDHIFYNYRIFLLFWLLIGVVVAQIRVGRAEIARGEPPHMQIVAGNEQMRYL